MIMAEIKSSGIAPGSVAMARTPEIAIAIERSEPKKVPIAIPDAQPPLQASYAYNRASRQVVITLVNPATGEVVAQIPPAKVIEVATALIDVASRVLDRTA
jgi:hypothetical protein